MSEFLVWALFAVGVVLVATVFIMVGVIAGIEVEAGRRDKRRRSEFAS